MPSRSWESSSRAGFSDLRISMFNVLPHYMRLFDPFCSWYILGLNVERCVGKFVDPSGSKFFLGASRTGTTIDMMLRWNWGYTYVTQSFEVAENSSHMIWISVSSFVQGRALPASSKQTLSNPWSKLLRSDLETCDRERDGPPFLQCFSMPSRCARF